MSRHRSGIISPGAVLVITVLVVTVGFVMLMTAAGWALLHY
jgi:hypothetical protein